MEAQALLAIEGAPSTGKPGHTIPIEMQTTIVKSTVGRLRLHREVASISQQVVCDNVQAAARAVKGTKAMTAVWNALAQVLGATIATSRLAQLAQY